MFRLPLASLPLLLALALLGRSTEAYAEDTPQPAAPSVTNLANTSWVGQEHATDTSYLKFVFQKDGTAIAYDNLGAWRGIWRMMGQRDVMIELKQPNPVNYTGQIEGNHIKGTGRQLNGKGSWNWDVEIAK